MRHRLVRRAMSDQRFALAAASAVTLLAGCGATLDRAFCDESNCVFSDDEWGRLQALSPIPSIPDDPSNQFRGDPQAQSLGNAFFLDASFSGPATDVDALGRPSVEARAERAQPTGVRCATCHDLSRAGSDVSSLPNNVSAGAGWTDVNAPAIVGSAFQHLLFLNGRADSAWALAVAVAESGTTMNGNRLKTAWAIADGYRASYDVVFAPAGFPLPLSGTSVDLSAILDPATGQCLMTNGACPSGCRMVTSTCGASVCSPRFPLQGKPGAQAGCQAACNAGEPFDDAFDCMDGDDQTAVTRVLVNWAKALDAYQALLVPGPAPFDRFVAEGAASDALSPAAKRGARLFVGKGACVDCHSGPLFSDGDFHDIGVPQDGPLVPTMADCPAGNAACDCVNGVKCLPWGAWDGLGKLAANKFLRSSAWSDSADDADPIRAAALSRVRTTSPNDPLKGAWRTPSLRNATLTAPYMHDGYYGTLAEVVQHYSDGGTTGGVGIPAVQFKALLLSPDEQSDLVAFLESLTSADSTSSALTANTTKGP
ncbi:MAG TPA: cytochrome c peroxidase [Polyangia bacterium]|jgi:cytochrome c peroxidase